MVVDDLAGGSAHHQLKAGALVLTVDYWSTRAMTDWTPAAVKTLSLSVMADGAANVGLSGLTVRVERLTVDGWVAVPAGSVTQPVVRDVPSIASPTSAGATVLVADVPSDSYALRYTLVYTATITSKHDTVQATGTDSLVVGLTGTVSS